jgi:ABC-type glutathione transport system ATPase component
MIELVHISKWYTRGFFRREKQFAAKDVTLSIRKGETLGLVGASGSGKTTLGRIALGLIRPSSGTVRVDGTDLFCLSHDSLRRFRQRMQIVFQDPDTSLNPRLRVEDCVAEPLRIWKLAGPAGIRDRTAELLATVGLQPDLATRYPFELSGGQKQRVALARVLALDPEFIVADEPTAALDLSVQAQILSLLQEVRQKRGITLLFISHDLEVIRTVSDTIAVMHEGSVVEQGKTGEVLRRPRHPCTARMVAAAQETGAWFGRNVTGDESGKSRMDVQDILNTPAAGDFPERKV